MASSPQYNFGAIGSMDYYSLMNNPYFLAAMQTANPNFKASKTTETQNTQAAAAQTTNNDGAIPVISSSQQSADSGSNFVTGALATVLIGGGALWALKSGKLSQVSKAFKSLTGKGETTQTTALSKLRAIKNGNGELKIQVPKKTKTFAGNNLENGVREYGVQSSVSAAQQAYNPAISKARSFQVVTPADSYTVIVKDGKITKVVSALMKKDEDVLARLVNAEAKTSDAELLDRFKKIAEELGKDSKEVDKSVFKDVVNIRYSNQYGDDTLNLVMKKYGEDPTLQSFRTLEQFDRTSDAVRAYVPSTAEEVFAEDLVNQTGGWFNKKGVLVDGVSVLKCEENLAGAKCFFEGNNLVKVKIGDIEYPSNSIGYKEFIKNNKDVIEKFQKDVFEDKIASRIPKGAVIGTV